MVRWLSRLIASWRLRRHIDRQIVEAQREVTASALVMGWEINAGREPSSALHAVHRESLQRLIKLQEARQGVSGGEISEALDGGEISEAQDGEVSP